MPDWAFNQSLIGLKPRAALSRDSLRISERLTGSNLACACRRLEDDLYSTTAAPGAFQTALQKIEREAFASRPNQRLHVELGYRPADVRPAAVAALGHGAELQAMRFDAPAEP